MLRTLGYETKISATFAQAGVMRFHLGIIMRNIFLLSFLCDRPDSGILSFGPSSLRLSTVGRHPTEHWYKQRHLHRIALVLFCQRSIHLRPKVQTALRKPCCNLGTSHPRLSWETASEVLTRQRSGADAIRFAALECLCYSDLCREERQLR